MMDEKMKEQMMDELEKLGIDKDMVDDNVIQGSKKLMFGAAKVMRGLKAGGMDEDDAREKVKMMVEKMTEPEMMKKIEEMLDKKDDWK